MSAAVAPFPLFHEGNIKNWFLQMEAIFTVSLLVSNPSKFGHVVAVLPPAIVDEVSDFLEAVPEDSLPTPSLYEKPTRQKNTMADSILKSLWLDRLPTTITQILAPMSENTSIDQLADAADRIFSQLDNQTMPVHSAEATRDHSSLEKTVEDLQRQVKDLTLAIESHGRSRFPSRRRFRSRPRSSSRNKDATPTMCYYHRRFGSAAHYCTKPCSYTAVAGKQNRQRVKATNLAGKAFSPKLSRLFYVTDTRNNLRFWLTPALPLVSYPCVIKHVNNLFSSAYKQQMVPDLRLKMANLCYTPPRHCPSDIYLPHQLKDCEFVFVRNDSVKRPLTPAYTGPYRVLKRADKYFQIQKGIHTDNVSIDRLKPAFIEKPSSHTTSQSTPQVQENFKTPVSLDKPKYTSSGRKVTFPKKFETFYYY
ncbi:unnamed protein product [Acanthosepion pharaonis]|uniref:Uncharacterized protein n=1 Tax=Acanthosepion pharaonis TaxID=158019 RepID=A0A812C0J9_ACAPH|nr:unnamed protein product [Sepia pharaonis]